MKKKKNHVQQKTGSAGLTDVHDVLAGLTAVVSRHACQTHRLTWISFTSWVDFVQKYTSTRLLSSAPWLQPVSSSNLQLSDVEMQRLPSPSMHPCKLSLFVQDMGGLTNI